MFYVMYVTVRFTKYNYAWTYNNTIGDMFLKFSTICYTNTNAKFKIHGHVKAIAQWRDKALVTACNREWHHFMVFKTLCIPLVAKKY